MNTKQLSYIIAITECQSLSAASEKLHISQPALSKYLNELEQELGLELFIRHKKHLYLNNAGRIYVDAARKVIEVKEQTYNTIASLNNSFQTEIRIGVTPLRGSMAVASIFADFQRRFPNTKLTFCEQYSANLRQSVINHSVNMSLGTTFSLEDPNIEYISAHTEEFILFVPSFHPVAAHAQPIDRLTSIDFKELQDVPFIIGAPGSTSRAIFDFFSEAYNFHPTVVFESDNNLVQINMVKRGVGACILPLTYAQESPDIVYFSLQPKAFGHLSLFVSKGYHQNEAERFLTYLLFSEEGKHTHYISDPTPSAKEILDEFSPTRTESLSMPALAVPFI